MIYSKEDLAGLPIQPWTSLRDFYDNNPSSVELTRSHIVLSRSAWGAIIADPMVVGSVEPVTRHAQLIQGYIGELVGGPALFTDAYDLHGVFEGTTQSYVIVPPERTKPLPDPQDPNSFLVSEE
jgi:hypothetical protein